MNEILQCETQMLIVSQAEAWTDVDQPRICKKAVRQETLR
jgi:hypothetical protein